MTQIIMDEISHCKKLITFNSKLDVSNITQKNLNILAKYYNSEVGVPYSKIHKHLISWILEIDNNFNSDLEENQVKIDRAVKYARVNKLRGPINLMITNKEALFLKSFGDESLEKIAFCMLVVSRFFKFNKSKIDPNGKLNYALYCNFKLKSIISLAGMNIPKKEYIPMLHKLYVLGAIEPTKKGSFLIKFADDEQHDPAIVISEYSSICSYYSDWRNGTNSNRCKKCGKIVFGSGKKLCPDCSKS